MIRPPRSANVEPMLPDPEPLSSREHEILLLLARGHTNREIADRLHISLRTAEWYRASIRRKLNISSRAGLVAFAITRGLIQFDS
jgi:two-component system nitrate/nitrite response regulator NarL